MSRVLVLSLALLSPALLLAAPGGAAELAGVQMDDTTKVGEETLVLNGLGLRKKAIFKIYVGGLYLPAKQSNAGKIFAADATRRMVMHVLYSKLSQDQLADGWDDCLEANRPKASAELKKSFEQLNGWMEEVKEGGRLTFTYTPAGGTEVQVKGSAKGSIAGKGFADALFACWIGDKPATGALKKGLLGG
ncbi:MAG: hypothetical protein GY719_05175 [bacterium]|nr:hypothetical protein [bacterium]